MEAGTTGEIESNQSLPEMVHTGGTIVPTNPATEQPSVVAISELSPEEKSVELRCKKCRRVLANSSFLIPHIPKSALHPPHPKYVPQPCSHHFVEPLKWMSDELEQGLLEGKLSCPQCHSKVGHYCWQGMRCSCEEWIVPGISLARSRVDERRVSASASSITRST